MDSPCTCSPSCTLSRDHKLVHWFVIGFVDIKKNIQLNLWEKKKKSGLNPSEFLGASLVVPNGGFGSHWNGTMATSSPIWKRTSSLNRPLRSCVSCQTSGRCLFYNLQLELMPCLNPVYHGMICIVKLSPRKSCQSTYCS